MRPRDLYIFGITYRLALVFLRLLPLLFLFGVVYIQCRGMKPPWPIWSTSWHDNPGKHPQGLEFGKAEDHLLVTNGT